MRGAALMRRPLDSCLEPTQMLRVFRERDGLFGLIGAWHDSRTVIGFSPTRQLPVDADPFDAIARLPTVGGEATFGGGWVGAFGYRLGGRLEKLPPAPPRPVPLPPHSLAFYDHVLVRDDQGWWFEALVDDDNLDRIEASYDECARLVREPAHGPQPYSCADFVATPDAAGHLAAVSVTLGHLAAGDIFQANICRRFEAGFSGDALDAFCAGVERLAPSYAAFLRTSEGAIASLSPELFLRRTGCSVRTSPIKGTAPLDVDVERLVASAKDRAENVMIVDLMRNDLGRVCVPGSVLVEGVARAEQRAGVWHLVSDVVGTLAPGEDDGSLLRATFPPGSVTGAPKVRAMEVIHEVETTGREIYTGAVGYVSPAAGLELNVAIRTFEFAAGRVWFGAGGGVVIDSIPEGERAETLVKARPLVAAIGARLLTEEEDVAPLGTARLEREMPPTDLPREVDPGIDLSRGVFTTLLVEGGRPVDLDAHLARLGRDAERLYETRLPDDLAALVRDEAAGLEGPHRLRITLVPDEPPPPVEITTAPVSRDPALSLRLVPFVVPGGLGDHKYADRSRLEDAGQGLIIDQDGSVLETWKGNVFVVTDEAVHTPALDGRLLPGVTRQRAIEQLQAAGVPVVQRRLTLSDLATAVEVFATGSIDRVRAVSTIETVGTWDVGPTTVWLADRLSGQPAAARATAAARQGSADVELLVVDNYDSFVYNLDQYVRELGARTHVVRNDALDLDEIASRVDAGHLHGVIISPGPGTPSDAGLSTELVRRLGATVPILGVCLGHQCIAAAYGARIVAADAVVHGKPSIVHHDGRGVFDGLEGPLVVGRYHSLVVPEAGLPPELIVTARTGSGAVMGIRHREHPVEGVQFHPESILSRHGHHLLSTFLLSLRET